MKMNIPQPNISVDLDYYRLHFTEVQWLEGPKYNYRSLNRQSN